MRHPAVREAAVVAMSHPRWQERPFLIVVLMEDATVTIDDLCTHLLRFVPKWWLPDAIAFAAAELPHGPTGKLQKDEIRRRVADGTIVPVTAPTDSGPVSPPSRTA
jgi:3-(methylthio)propionyl---CoA ligase